MGFFGIGVGPSNNEKSQYNNLTAASGFATGAGEGDLTASNQFFQDLLSGDPTKVSQALAPEVSAQQKQNQQQKDEIAQFGPRSGGTAAAVTGIDTAGRGNLINLAGGLMGHSADSLASTGSNLLNTGISGDISGFGEAKTMHDQSESALTSLINSITGTLGGGIAGFEATPAGGSQTAGTLTGILGALGG